MHYASKRPAAHIAPRKTNVPGDVLVRALEGRRISPVLRSELRGYMRERVGHVIAGPTPVDAAVLLAVGELLQGRNTEGAVITAIIGARCAWRREDDARAE